MKFVAPGSYGSTTSTLAARSCCGKILGVFQFKKFLNFGLMADILFLLPYLGQNTNVSISVIHITGQTVQFGLDWSHIVHWKDREGQCLHSPVIPPYGNIIGCPAVPLIPWQRVGPVTHMYLNVSGSWVFIKGGKLSLTKQRWFTFKSRTGSWGFW